MINVLFVCLGNICRSPMAEGLFIHKVKEAGLDERIRVDSAGTGGWHVGERADARMRRVASQHGVDLPSRARKITVQDFKEFDYILAMDGRNLKDIEAKAPQRGDHPANIYKMRHFDPQAKGADVPDPYYGGPQGFEEVYQMLDRSTNQLLASIREETGI